MKQEEKTIDDFLLEAYELNYDWNELRESIKQFLSEKIGNFLEKFHQNYDHMLVMWQCNNCGCYEKDNRKLCPVCKNDMHSNSTKMEMIRLIDVEDLKKELMGEKDGSN